MASLLLMLIAAPPSTAFKVLVVALEPPAQQVTTAQLRQAGQRHAPLVLTASTLVATTRETAQLAQLATIVQHPL
jgi:CheY-like chemotaxis protein